MDDTGQQMDRLDSSPAKYGEPIISAENCTGSGYGRLSGKRDEVEME